MTPLPLEFRVPWWSGSALRHAGHSCTSDVADAKPSTKAPTRAYSGIGTPHRFILSASSRRAFTLLEVMLASMLGLIVVIAAMGLFTTLSASDRQSNESYHRHMELSLAHPAIERAMRGLVMDSTPYPRPTTTGAASRLQNRPGSKPLTEADGSAAVDAAPSPFKRARFLLEPDTRLPPAMKYEDEKGMIRYITPQRMELTLSRPPVYAPPTAEERREAQYNDLADEAALKQRHRPRETARRASAHGGSSTRGGSTAASGSSGKSGGATRTGNGSRPGNDQLTDMARRAGVSADALAAAIGNGPDGTDPDADEEADIALWPGLRGVFEVRWDPAPSSARGSPTSISAGSRLDETLGSWSLWWRPIPQVELALRNADEPVPDFLSASDLLLDDGTPARDLARGSVMLASNLETCRWEVVRNSETLDSVQCTWLEELPAYATLELRTKSGLWMKWMFEVDWTRGGEPGEPMDTINTFRPGAINDPADPTANPTRPGGTNGTGLNRGTPRTPGMRPADRNGGNNK